MLPINRPVAGTASQASMLAQRGIHHATIHGAEDVADAAPARSP
jgi:hypothetical protein